MRHALVIVALGAISCGGGSAVNPPVGSRAADSPPPNAVPPATQPSAPAPIEREPTEAAAPPVAPLPPFDLDAEIAWARQSFDTLQSVRFDDLAPKLVAWVAVGKEIEAYWAHGKTCERVTLRNPKPEASDADEADSDHDTSDDGDDAPENVALEMLHGVGYKREDGFRVRFYSSASVGHDFYLPSGGGSDRWEQGGWVTIGGWGSSDVPEWIGTLSDIDGDVARFEGVPVRADVSCDGPLEVWDCPGGGQRTCDTCRTARVEVREQAPNTQYGRGGYRAAPTVLIGAKDQPVCTDRCPKHDPPHAERIHRLFSESNPWLRAAPDGDADSVSVLLYRTKRAARKDPRRRCRL